MLIDGGQSILQFTELSFVQFYKWMSSLFQTPVARAFVFLLDIMQNIH